MKIENCPKCGRPGVLVEFTIYDDELFEEITCPVCGYYDSKISELGPGPIPGEIPEDFEF